MKEFYVVPIHDDEFSLSYPKYFECGLHVFRYIHSNGRYGSALTGVRGPKNRNNQVIMADVCSLSKEQTADPHVVAQR